LRLKVDDDNNYKQICLETAVRLLLLMHAQTYTQNMYSNSQCQQPATKFYIVSYIIMFAHIHHK